MEMMVGMIACMLGELALLDLCYYNFMVLFLRRRCFESGGHYDKYQTRINCTQGFKIDA